jgi:4-nitrophenol 2-monooxygenase / 4-nitrocatechol 4-monooxygenase, reductase component
MTRANEPETATIPAEAFRAVIGRFASGVTVVTTRQGDSLQGTTASAVSSVSLDPALVLICMNQRSLTGQTIAATGRFAINILGEEQRALALQFAVREGDKFNGLEWRHGEGGMPLLEAAIATLECRVVNQLSAGTHYVFIGAVVQAANREGAPLAYYRGQFGRFVPAS